MAVRAGRQPILVGEDFRDPRIALEAISSIEQVAVVSPKHPLALRSRSGDVSLPDLADHSQIVLSDPTPLSEGRSFGVLSPQICLASSQDAKQPLS
jgi:DNA-binding transcriptional LysR family regulator